MSEYVITDFGIVAAENIVTKEIQKVIDQAAAAGGGRVVIPAGRFLTGALQLKDNVELHLLPGAVLQFSDSQADYPVVTSRWEGVERQVYAACLYAFDAKNIAVTGFGTLDGNGKKWWQLFRRDRKKLAYPRPMLVSFEGCERVTLKDFTCINSPSWTIHPQCCRNVTIDNLNICNPADSPNTDGIDPESCQNVRIANCNIDVGDDCIAIKAGTEDTPQRIPCENITITNCTMVHGHGGVVLGSEMSGGIKNVTITNCVFQDTDRGIRLKSRRGRGGVIEDIRIDNLVMERVLCPFILNLYYFCGPRGKERYVWDKTPYPITEETPRFRRIHFANITARNVHAAAGFIYGLAEQHIEEVSFDNIAIEMAEDAIAGRPAMMSGIKEMQRRGFYIGFGDNLLFRNVSIRNHAGPAFTQEGCKDLHFVDCQSLAPRDQAPLVYEQEVVILETETL